MVSISGGAFGCGVEFVLGEEIVYNFATRPPERALFRFVSRERGLSGSPTTWFSSDFLKQWAIKGSLSVYAGFIWGFNDWSDIQADYQGSVTSGSVGLTFDIPAPQAPYVSMGLGAGIGKFKSDTTQVQGYTGYVSGGVQVGLPSAGFGMATSVIKTNYSMHSRLPTPYGSREQANLQMLGDHIRSGDGTPLINAIVGYLGGPIVSALVRNPAADIGVHVVREHYAGGGR